MAESKLTIEDFISQMNKSFGANTFMKLGDNVVKGVPCNKLGVASLDDILGGGLAKGRIIEIYGPESSGKTSLSLMAIAESQKEGGQCGFIDAEHALDTDYAHKLGVDLPNLTITQPDYGEQALELLDRMVDTGLFSVIVVDSVAALTPKAELEGEMGESKIGLHARLMSQALRKITAKVHKTNTTVIFINQLREKIGVMFGNPEVTTGGNALKFYASQRLDVRKGPQIKEGDIVVGGTMRISVIKNKIAPPFRKTELKMYFNKGIDKMDDLLNICEAKGIIKKGGSWYSYGDTKLGQGAVTVANLLRDNPELVEELQVKLNE